MTFMSLQRCHDGIPIFVSDWYSTDFKCTHVIMHAFNIINNISGFFYIRKTLSKSEWDKIQVLVEKDFLQYFLAFQDNMFPLYKKDDSNKLFSGVQWNDTHI